MKKTIAAVIIIVLTAMVQGGILAMATKPSGRPAGPAPDLVITDLKIDQSHIKKDQKVTIIYKVKNQGKVMSGKSITNLSIGSSANKQIANVSSPALAPGGSYTGQVDYVVPAAGKYVFKASADYKNNVFESNEMNNERSVSFSFGRKL
ncbi:MAG: CARDB domain-containing protein [Candidatus Margulisiibacteriota bacterium]